MKLHDLSPTPGSTHKKKRIGRGIGSGHGKTATRGTKGQKSRSGSSVPPWFEGGKMPLQRLIPKRGFKNINRTDYKPFNLKKIEELGMTEVNPETLYEKKLIKWGEKIKILAEGSLSKAVNFKVHALSKAAKEKIESAGGTFQTINFNNEETEVVK
ncbi:50S ribosomal protein L15 [candidate division WOR-3 bacterium]|nr:50S ribosomal protein L15 [candidate division WOR-3 bacterium]